MSGPKGLYKPVTFIFTMQDVTILRPYDILSALEDIDTRTTVQEGNKRNFPKNWRHLKFKQYLAQSTSSSLTFTFKEIEAIEGIPFPSTAFKFYSWWYPRQDGFTIAEAWLTEGYVLAHLDLDRQKLRLTRDRAGLSRLHIPDVLLSNKVPDNAVFELEQHMTYIIKKYGL